MYQRIIDYVNDVFKDVKDNSVSGFTKKGFIRSLTKKYEENLAKGFSEDEAFNLAVSQCPEIFNVAKDMGKYMGRNRQSEEFHYSKDGKEFYHSKDDDDDDEVYKYKSASEEFGDKLKEKRFLANFSSIFWPLVVCAYFLYSFLVPDAWAYSWTIFVIGAVIQCFVKICFAKTSAARLAAISSVLWLTVVIAYLCISIVTKLWAYTWLMFVGAAAIQCLIAAVTGKGLSEKQAAIGGFVWLLIVLAYVLVSLLTGRWDITWIIFIFGIALHSVVRIIVDKIYLGK